MRKVLITKIFLLIALVGFSTAPSTTNSDTTWPAEVRAMRNALRVNDSLAVMKQERASLLELKAMYEKMTIKDSLLIAQMDKNISLADRLIKNLESQVGNSEKQTDNEKKINLNLRGIIRKKNWQLVKVAGLSLTVIGTMGFLLLKK